MILIDSLETDGMRHSVPLEVCEDCGGTLEKDVELFGRVTRVRKVCFCRVRVLEEKERVAREREKQIYLDRIFKNSFLDERFRCATFENWDHSRGDKKLYTIALKYAMNYKKVLKDSIGLFINGNPGNGKSYAVCCIANYLLSRGVPTICISINALLDRIKATYDSSGRGDEESVIRSFCKADFLIIDDLGTELKNEWGSSRIYRIIDERYRNNLPTVITTNLTFANMNKRYDERVSDRLREMCTRVSCEGRSIRDEVNRDKSKKFMEMMK